MTTWQQFCQKHTHKHWTAKGRFKIEPETIGGSILYQLWFNDRNLGNYLYPQTAADELHDGKHDYALGFSPKEANVPPSLGDWNGLE